MNAPTDPPARPTRWERVRRFVGLSCVCACGVTILVSAIAWRLPFRVAPNDRPYEAVFALAFFTRVYLLPMAAGCAALAILSFVCRRRYTAVVCALMSIGWAMPEVVVATRHLGRAPQSAGAPNFTIASFNLNAKLIDGSRAIDLARRWDPTFIVFQELTPAMAKQLEDALSDRYPHRQMFPMPGFHGAAIFSKEPLQLVRPPVDGRQRNLTVQTVALGRPFVLDNIHLAPAIPTDQRTSNRRQTVELIDAHNDDLAKGRSRVLIGDFNFTSFSPQGSALSAAGLLNAHRHLGGGRQTTWPARGRGPRVPTARIDHVFVTGSALTPVDIETGPPFGSDHLPVRVTFR